MAITKKDLFHNEKFESIYAYFISGAHTERLTIHNRIPIILGNVATC